MYGANRAVDSRRVAIAQALIDEARCNGGRASAFSYSVLLKGYGRARKLNTVKKTLGVMRQQGVKFDNVTYNTAVDAFVRCGELSAARELVEDKEYAGLRDTRTFNTLLKGLAREGRVEEAFSVRDDICALGLVPNEVTQNSLVDACVIVGDFDAAMRLADEMAPGPGSVGGSDRNQLTIALSRILGGMAEGGRIKEAERLLGEMTKRGAPPNHITYCSLINACLKQNDVRRAMELFRSLKEVTGRQPSLLVYNSVIGGLCKAGNEFYVDTAVRMLGELRERSSMRDVGTVGHGYCVRAAEETEPANSENQSRSTRTNGSGDALSTLRGNSRGIEAPLIPSDVTYNAVIDGLVNFSRVHDAEDVLEWMREDGVMPSVITYTTLVKGWAVERDLGQARRLFRCMTSESIAPDTLAYNALINACVRADNSGAADKLLKMMEAGVGDSDVRPDVYSYTPLIALHTRDGDLEEMWATYRRAREHGMKVNKYVIDLVVNAIASIAWTRVRQGRPEEREKVASMATGILDDAWNDLQDRTSGRRWRKSLMKLFEFDDELSARVAYAGGAGSLRSASEVIFEKHGWNEFKSGWRAF